MNYPLPHPWQLLRRLRPDPCRILSAPAPHPRNTSWPARCHCRGARPRQHTGARRPPSTGENRRRRRHRRIILRTRRWKENERNARVGRVRETHHGVVKSTARSTCAYDIQRLVAIQRYPADMNKFRDKMEGHDNKRGYPENGIGLY